MSDKPDQSKPDIAIVGMASLFAESNNLEAYWDLIRNKVDAIIDVPASRWHLDDYFDEDKSAADKVYCRRGGFIPDIDFDPMAFGLPPNILELTDTSQLLSLVVAQDALQDAGLSDASAEQRNRIGVVLGVGGGQKINHSLNARLHYPVLKKVLLNSGVPAADADMIVEKFKSQYVHWEENSFPGSLGNVIAGRIANRFDLGGMNCVVDAACAGSLAATKMALSELWEGRADVMLTGGVCTDNSPQMYMSFSKTPAFTDNHVIQPFDKDSKGMMIGEGIGMVALKRLADAERDGDRIYAVVKGVGTSSDGKFKSIYAPRPEGQAKALNRAYQDAGFAPHTVGLVEAHGTGTAAGDVAEFEGLKQVFALDNPRKQHIALGSVKSQIGHTKSTAGTAGFIKAALALHHKVLPPTINVNEPNPKMAIEDSPFYINSETRPWISQGVPRRAGISSFGFGGTNYHVVLEEYQTEASQAYRFNANDAPILMAAATPEQLVALCQTWLQQLTEPTDFDRFRAEFTVQPIHGDHARLGFVVNGIDALKAMLSQAINQLNKDATHGWQSGGMYYQPSAKAFDGKVAALFAGQGSQYVNMGLSLANAYPVMRQHVAELDALLAAQGQTALSQVLYPIPAFNQSKKQAQQQAIQNTRFAQPAIGALSLSTYQLMQQAGFSADFFAGHSFGELTALAAADIITPKDYLNLCVQRGCAMANVPQGQDCGAMMAVVLSDEGQRAVLVNLLEQQADAWLANDNSPTQLVLAGAATSLSTLANSLKAQGIKTIDLPVSAAFHTPLVEFAQQPFATAIENTKFKANKQQVFSNTSGAPYGKTAKSVKQNLQQHMLSSVKFTEQLTKMYQAGARLFVEFGPKSILSRLVKDTLPHDDVVTVAVNGNPKQDSDTQLKQAMVQLAVLGIELTDFDQYKLAPKPEKSKGSPLTISLGGQNYLSPATQQKMQQALSQGQVSVTKPQIIEKEVIKEVVKHVPVATPAAENNSDSIPLSEPQAMSENVPSAMNPPSELAQLLQQQQTALAESMAMFQQQQNQSIQLQQNFIQQNAQLSQQLVQLMAGQAPTVAMPSAIAQSAPIQEPIAQSTASLSNTALANAAQTSAEQVTTNPVVPISAEQVAQEQPTAVEAAPVSTVNTTAAVTQGTHEAAAINAEQVQQTMLAVVGEKTGYPAEMLELSMDLEADLGIDSIKRVEILGTVQDNLPALPALNPEDLAELRTLAEIVQYMQQQLAPAANQSQPMAIAQAEAGNPPNEDVQSVMMAVVADKTGYPAEMLELTMDLEADLGIDSIKRVEILGTVQDKLPTLPALNPEDLAELRTLGEIVDYMHQQGGDLAPAQALTPAESSAHGSQQVQQVMLEVVADKTGYPAEMLELNMDLEADLGIDSIKRVEILGTVQDQLPSLPALNPEDLAELRTLGEIVQYMNAQFAPQAQDSSEPSVAVNNAAGLSAEAVQQAMLDVVAQKTGYPAEMLELGMDLEADLGIDSIKRVEILGTVQDQLPALPALNPEDLAELRTLGEIVQYMNAQLSPTAATGQAEAEQGQAQPSSQQIQQAMLSVVADKTGYPAEMLELTMDLEADLGIDSIKRVEILGTVQDTLPSLPALNPEDLAELRTLGEIVDYMNAQLSTSAANVSAVNNTEPAQETNVPFQYALMRPLAPLNGGQAYQGQVIIVDDGHRGGLIAEKLLQQGLQPELIALPDAICAASAMSSDVTCHQLADASETSISELCKTWLAAQDQPLAFIQLFNSQLSEQNQQQVTAMALLFAKHLQPRLSQVGSRYLSAGELDGGFGLRQGLAPGFQYSAAFAGLTKTLAQEWPDTVCRALDLAECEAQDFAQTLVDELLSPRQDAIEVAYHQGERVAIVAESANQLKVEQQSYALSPQDVVLVSGGAKGVTNACVAELAAHSQACFILLGRSAPIAVPDWAQGLTDKAALQSAALAHCQQQGEKPTPASLSKMIAPVLSQLEIDRGLNAITAAGGQAHYAAVDVTDEAALTELVSQVQQRHGAITALVHGAGVLADGMIENKQLPDFERVFATKVAGLQALLNALQECQLSHIALFSSAAGFYGNKGQSDYAMANEVLNKTAIALAQARPSCRVLSFNWGPWDGGMVTPELKRMFEQRGVYVIPVAGGAQLFRQHMLAGDKQQVQVIVGSDMAGNHAEQDGSQSEQQEELAKVKKSLAQRLYKTLTLAHNDFLQLHQVAGNPVLPTVVATAWMRQGISQLLPDYQCLQMQDYQLYKGIVFTPEQDSVALTLQYEVLSTSSDGVQVKASISSQVGGRVRMHYAALLTVSVAGEAEKQTKARLDTVSQTELQLSVWLKHGQASNCYQDGSLFHQGEFCLLQQDLLADDTQLVQTATVAELSPGFFGQFASETQGIAASVLAEDGLYQSLLVWVYRNLGKASLPAGYEAVVYGDISALVSQQPLVITSQIVRHNQYEVIADISLLAANGQALMTMKHAKVVLMQANTQLDKHSVKAEKTAVAARL